MCWEAAAAGHLNMLKYAREKGREWDKYTGALAAENGHLDVLQWCVANGCPVDWGEWAAVAGTDEVRDWIKAQAQ